MNDMPHTPSPSRFNPAAVRHAAVITLAGLVAHGLLLVNDGVYWDSWVVHTFIAEGKWDALVEMTRNAGGFPVNLYLRWGLGQLPGVVTGFHLAVFVALLGSAWLIYVMAQRSGWLTRQEAVTLAVFTLVYPAYQTSVELNTAKYPITWFVFLLACWCAIGLDRASGARRTTRRVAALALFALSFGTASLLVFYWWFFALWLLSSREPASAQDSAPRTSLVRQIITRVDFVVLPFLYWFASRTLYPQRGDHIGENAIDLTWERLTSGADGFFAGAIRAHWEAAVARLSDVTAAVWYSQTASGWWEPVVNAFVPVPWVGLMAAVLVVCVFRASQAWTGPLWGRRLAGVPVLAVGLVGLVCGTFPYIAVGSWPAESGWSTRHALLVALPLGLCVVGLLRLVFAGASRRWNAVGYALAAVLLMSFTLSTLSYYLAWQARWVKDRSIVEHLSTMPEGARYSVFWVADGVGMGVDGYRFYEYAGMFRRAWGAPGRIGWDIRFQTNPAYTGSVGPAQFTERNNLEGFDPLGCQAVLYIRRGPAVAPPVELALRYLYYRAFHPERVASFVANVTIPEIVPEPAPAARNCPA